MVHLECNNSLMALQKESTLSTFSSCSLTRTCTQPRPSMSDTTHTHTQHLSPFYNIATMKSYTWTLVSYLCSLTQMLTFLQLFTKLFHFWVAFLLNHYGAGFQQGLFGVLFHQTVMQALVLLFSSLSCFDFLQIRIWNNVLICKLIHNSFCINVCNETWSQHVQNLFNCINGKGRVVLHKLLTW